MAGEAADGPHVLAADSPCTGEVVFWDTAQAEVICRMEELLQPGFFGERPQVDFFDAGAYRELPYLLAPLLARLTGRTVEVHIVKDGTGLTDTAKGELREFVVWRGDLAYHRGEAGAVPLERASILGALQADTANRGKDLPSAAELQEEMDAQPPGVTYVPHQEPEASWPADFPKSTREFTAKRVDSGCLCRAVCRTAGARRII